MSSGEAAGPESVGAGVVRVPGWLAGYACRRTLVCCHAPWRPEVRPGERQAVAEALAAKGSAGAREVAERWRTAVVRRAGLEVLRQVDERCVLLDVAEPACTLHREGGLNALVEACRSFPRSIAETPHGVEVAFALGCPTATGLVLEGEGGFAFSTLPADRFPFRASLRVGARIPWSHAVDLDFEELAALRLRWWRRLGEVSDGAALFAAVAALASDPGAPEAHAHGVEPEPRGLEGAQLQRITASLTRLPRRGPTYAARLRPVWTALREPARMSGLVALDAHAARALARALALGVQGAGVHLPGLAAEVLAQAAWRVVEVAHVAAALTSATQADPAEPVEPAEALADALVAVS